MKYVIDASFVASLFLPDEASEKTSSLARKLGPADATAPCLLQLEITNILLMAHRRKRITGVQLKQLSDAFENLPVSFQPALTGEQRATVLQLAEKHQLTAYDAAYLELCMRMGLGLATLDASLLKASKAEGVKVAL